MAEAVQGVMTPVPTPEAFDEAEIEWSADHRKATLLGIEVHCYDRFDGYHRSPGCSCGQCKDPYYEFRVGDGDECFEEIGTYCGSSLSEGDTLPKTHRMFEWWRKPQVELAVRRIAWKLAVQEAVGEFTGRYP